MCRCASAGSHRPCRHGAPPLSISPLIAPGVYHSAELYYVFDALSVREWPWEAADRHLADAMSSYWVNFGKTGDPNLPGLPQWGAYEPNGGGMVMELGTEIGMRAEPRRDRYEFFDALYGKLTCNDRSGGTTLEPRPGVKAMRRQEGPAARTAAKHASAAAADRHRSRPGSNLS